MTNNVFCHKVAFHWKSNAFITHTRHNSLSRVNYALLLLLLLLLFFLLLLWAGPVSRPGSGWDRQRMQHAGASSGSWGSRRFSNLNKFWTQFQFSPKHTHRYIAVRVCVHVWRPAAHHQALSIKTFSACLALILIKCESGWELWEHVRLRVAKYIRQPHGRRQQWERRRKGGEWLLNWNIVQTICR